MLPPVLPPLREDLQLHPAAPYADGAPSWVIQDPISNGFIRLGWLEFELLSRWGLGSPQAVIEATEAETLLTPSEEELEALYLFLLRNQLLVVRDSTYLRKIFANFQSARGSHLQRLLHHYLFFRVPLIHPAEHLKAILPWLMWVFRPLTAWCVVACGVLGLILTARQWDVFVSSLVDTLSPGGILGYMLALVVTKSLHELGHALTATRYGLRVAHMGVAFMVMWPMLYTDTGESWRLADSRQRLKIASAGIIAELALAAIATLAWNLVGEGDLKQALFFLATTASLMSLAVNASPFMRFDGYFILSDILDMPNMHERSFALARTAMRNRLLGWNEPDPEIFPPGKRRALIIFSYGIWAYRFITFMGIAAAVYFYFFKLLGIFLFLVEIAWFVVLPIWRELKVWHERRHEITFYRKRLAASLLILGALIALVPWGYQVHGYGYIRPVDAQILFSPLPARVVSLPQSGSEFAADAVIFKLEQPEQRFKEKLAASSVEALDNQLKGLQALPEGEEKRQRLQTLWAMHTAEIAAEQDEEERLLLQAPFAGRLTDLDPELAPGVWVNGKQPLAVLLGHGQWQAEILVAQDAINRLAQGARVLFYPDAMPWRAYAGHIVDIDNTRTNTLSQPLLAATHGGGIPVQPPPNAAAPRDPLYRVRVLLDEMPTEQLMLRGNAIIEGEHRSWLLDVLKPVLIVLIRELSF